MIFERLPFNPTPQSLSTIATVEKLLTPENSDLAEWHQNYILGHKNRIALDIDITQNNVAANAKILEFGSIPLLLTKSLELSNYDVTGLDIAPERYTDVISRLGVNVIKCNIELERIPFEDNFFDAAIFNELFEHLRINPIFTLSEVLRVLKPEGVLMLSTPNLRSFVGINNFLFKNKAYSCSAKIYKEYKKLETLGHMGHVREYTTLEVTSFLRSIGFDVEKVVFRGRYFGYKRLILKIAPQLSPFVSYIAKKRNT